MLNDALHATLRQALRTAQSRKHEFVTLEHLLLALLDNADASRAIEACGGDLGDLRGELNEFVDANTPPLPNAADADGAGAQQNIKPTDGFERVIRRAVFHVQSTGKREVTGANLLVSLCSEAESQAVYFLKMQNIARLDVVNYIAHGISRLADKDNANSPEHFAGDAPEQASDSSPLDNFASNLNEEARAGRIDPLIGRLPEVERVSQILARRRKNNPLLVGESGVGKTAIAEGLAKLIVDGAVPELLKDSVVYALDLGTLLAGTRYRGDFEQRLKGLLAELRQRPGAILFIDEIHTIIGTGSASGSAMDASNLLKPILASGNLRCIGSTTFQEYRGIFDKDRALSRRFQKIDVLEPSVEDSYHILLGLKSRFEEHHGLRYTNSAMRVAAQLAERYITDRFLPDKAIDVVDEAGALQQLQPPAKRRKVIRPQEIEAVVARIARIPPKSVSASDKDVLRSLEDNLRLLVFGQERAINSLVTAIKLARAGLKAGARPIGSFLFAGPTGVGKTELSRQLARVLGLELIRIDMSEYMERHTVSRLIGAPPGYVGFDQGGLLTDAVSKNPHSVVLLDEIEKAHPEVFNLLLQVMDHGTLTDNNGRHADFRNIILIMTTNAGAESIARRSIGFQQQDHSSDAMEAIKRLFTPEFRNRLDAIIPFEALSAEVILTVVDKFLTELQAQLDEKRVLLQVDDAARQWLQQRGYDVTMGARPLERVIQEHIKKPLAEMVLFGALSRRGGTAHVGLDEATDELRLTAEELPTEPAANKKARDKKARDKKNTDKSVRTE